MVLVCFVSYFIGGMIGYLVVYIVVLIMLGGGYVWYLEVLVFCIVVFGFFVVLIGFVFYVNERFCFCFCECEEVLCCFELVVVFVESELEIVCLI